MTIEPSQDAWLELPDEVRQRLRVVFDPKPAEPAHARAAVGFARHRQRALRPALAATVGAFVLIAVWAVLAGRYPGTWAPLALTTMRVILVAALFVAAAAAGALVVAERLTSGLESHHLDAAVSGDLTGAPGPLTVHWRYGRARRAVHAVAVVASQVAIVWAIFAGGHLLDLLLYAFALFAVAGTRAYEWPWPVASSYPFLATVDDQGVHIHPLRLSVPWHRVIRIDITADFITGTGIVWRLDDPAAVAAAAPVSPGLQRRLLRWMTANGGAIRLNASQMAERPEAVYTMSARYRNHRTAVFSGLPSLDIG